MDYVYIDESGELAKQTKYFVSDDRDGQRWTVQIAELRAVHRQWPF